MDERLNPPRDGEGDQVKLVGGGPRPLQARIKQVKRARSLRKTMSLPEVLLWQQLRLRPSGLKFRRQFPIGCITTDFACLERRLIVEVDGQSHDFGDQSRRDAARDAVLKRQGFRVLRIAAGDVLRDLDSVVCGIVAVCSSVGPLHHSALPNGPPPRSGEK